MRFARSRRPAAEINLTALIDILFIVLLFLVMTATFADRTFLQLTLPRTTTGQRQADNPNAMRIVVDATGELVLDGQAIDLAGIGRRLAAAPNRDELLVVLAADERTPHGRVVEVLDTVRKAGVFRLNLETVPAAPR